MLESVDEINVQNARDAGVEDGKPVRLDLLLVGWQPLQVELCKGVADVDIWHATALLRNWVPNLGRRRSSGVGVWDRLAH